MKRQLGNNLRHIFQRRHTFTLTPCPPHHKRAFHQTCRQHQSSNGNDASEPPPPANAWIWDHPSVIDVSPLAESLRKRVREYTRDKALNLVGILANQGPHRHDSEVYSDRIQETFREDGIHYDLWRCPSGGGGGHPSPESVQRIRQQIELASQRQDVHGILVFYPIYNQHIGCRGPYKNRITGVYYKTHDDHFRDLVQPAKDVEGLRGTKWFQIKENTASGSNKLQLYPCTALSVLWILEEYHIQQQLPQSTRQPTIQSLPKYEDIHRSNIAWKNQTVSIVNRSEIMGRPLAAMLARKGATVYSIDIDSILQFRPNGRLHRCNPNDTTLESCLAASTIVVTGVPDQTFELSLDKIQDHATIVNVSEFPNICEETLLHTRPDVNYIPQVGKVTVAVLENNLMHLKTMHDRQRE